MTMSPRFRRLHARAIDLEATLIFYRDTLKLDQQTGDAAGLAFRSGDTEIRFAQVLDADDRMDLLHQWTAEYEVEDFPAVIERLRTLGSYFLVEPGPDAAGRMRAVVLDPSGHRVLLTQRGG
jgi:hypothetical protein